MPKYKRVLLKLSGGWFMQKTVNTFIYKGTLRNIQIFKSSEPYIPVYGAAALCFE